MTTPAIYIKFTSHRAREYAFRALGRKPAAFWSMTRSSHPGGIYQVSEAEVAVLKASPCRHAGKFTRLRGPFDDLRPCWSGEHTHRAQST